MFTYLIAESNPDDFQFFNRLQNVLDLIAIRHNINLAFGFHETMAADLMAVEYQDLEQAVTLRVVDDYRFSIRYLILTNYSLKSFIEVEELIRSELSILPLEKLQEQARESLENIPEILVKLALGSKPEPDLKTLEIFRLGLQNSNPKIRYRAVEAVGIAQWSELIPDLRYLAAFDPSPDVRAIAQQIIETSVQP